MNVEVEESNHYQKNSNCQNLYCSHFPISCRLDTRRVNKEFVKETNKIVFDFIWKGKDRVKCFAFISDIKMGD